MLLIFTNSLYKLRENIHIKLEKTKLLISTNSKTKLQKLEVSKLI